MRYTNDMDILQQIKNAPQLRLQLVAVERCMREVMLRGGRVYIVGGVVRDAVMGLEPSGALDIVVSGVVAPELEKILQSVGAVEYVGKNFGVFKLMAEDGHQIDIALPRKERSRGSGARTDFDVQSDPQLPIEEDLARRDFTVNAIAVDAATGEVVDPFFGMSDIQHKLLRAVGDPAVRFAEDYSRIVRGLRFAVTRELRFEVGTERALQAAVRAEFPRILGHELPYETITAEFIKSFDHDPLHTLKLWMFAGVLPQYLPELAALQSCAQSPDYHAEGSVWVHSLMAVEQLQNGTIRRLLPEADVELNLKLAVLFHDVGKSTTKKIELRNGVEHISFHGHDVEGARIFEAAAKRVALSSVGKKVDVELIAWLIRNHMLLVNQNPRELRLSTFASYFVPSRYPHWHLPALYAADSWGCIAHAANVQQQAAEKLKAVREIRQLVMSRGAEESPLLSGDEIQQVLAIGPGKHIGDYLMQLREAQLQGTIATPEDAKLFLRSLPKL